MRTFSVRLAIGLALLVPSLAAAQHEAHQAGAPQASAELTQCLRAQPVIENIITTASVRAEAARLSNSPAQLRAAVESLEAALRDIRAQSASCSTAAASTEPHAGHAMPGAAPQSKPGTPMMQPGSTAPAPGVPMDHSKMPMGGAQPTKPAGAPGAKPAAPGATDPHAGHAMPKPQDKPAEKLKPSAPSAKPAKAGSADPHAGHAMPTPQEKPASKSPGGDAKEGKVMDPVNGLMVDPATAPKTTYQGQTYYFSSEESRKEFLANPAKFAKKPKQ